MRWSPLAPMGLATALVLAPPSLALENPDLRDDLETLEAALDQAVGQVSHARPGALLGGATTRGYHLKGYGAVFVLAPRVLPRERKVIVVAGQRERKSVAEREARRVTEPARGEKGRDPELEDFLAQVELFQQAAEEQRAAAEEALQKVLHEVRARHMSVPEAAPSPPAVPSPPPAPAPESPQAPPPPWRFWFRTDDDLEPRPTEGVVSDVRAAVTATLETQGARLRALGSDEYVVVAVDFVPGVFFADDARPVRTLVVRVRKKELEQRQAGKMGPEELRKRIEYVEY